MSQISPATQWWADAVVAVCRGQGAPVIPKALQREAADFAARHRLEPLLFAWGVSEAGHDAYLHSLARGETALREALRTVQALEEVGIPALPMRGPFAGQRWHGDVGCRWFTDVDVLVPRPALVRAREVMGRLGYQPRQPGVPDAFYRAVHLHYPLIQPERGLLLDLHWAVDHPFVPHRIAYEELFAHAQVTDVGDARWRVPALAHEVIVQVAHLEKECVEPGASPWARAAAAGQVLGLLDLALMLARLDRDPTSPHLTAIAERWGLRDAVVYWCAGARAPEPWRDAPRGSTFVSTLETAGGFRWRRLAEARRFLVPPGGLSQGERLAHRMRAAWRLGSTGAVAAACLVVGKLRGARGFS